LYFSFLSDQTVVGGAKIHIFEKVNKQFNYIRKTVSRGGQNADRLLGEGYKQTGDFVRHLILNLFLFHFTGRQMRRAFREVLIP
jgi:hypothetical protein